MQAISRINGIDALLKKIDRDHVDLSEPVPIRFTTSDGQVRHEKVLVQLEEENENTFLNALTWLELYVLAIHKTIEYAPLKLLRFN